MRLARNLLACAAALLAAAMLPAQAAKPAPAVTALPVPLGVVKAAMAYRGVPYVLGGDSRQGLDCSGLVFRVFQDVTGEELPRSVGSLFNAGTAASALLHIGDLLFFDTTGDASPKVPTHVGLYAGGERFIHAASEGASRGVIVSTLQSSYYRDKFLGARRLIKWRAPELPIILTDNFKLVVQTDPFPSREAVKICIFNGMTGGGPVDVAILKGEAEVLSRRVTPGARKPVEITIVPDVGQWTVRIGRIFKGRELERVTFVVEE
jgi:hypothetical protein